MDRPSRTSRSAARAVITALALAGAVLVGSVTAAAPAAASSRGGYGGHGGHGAGVVYDALGDSYASGYGVPPYGDCGRSQSAYAVLLDGQRRLRLDDFAACAGATTVSLVTGGQLDALDRDTDLVTLTVGGNDIGWSTAVTACLGGTDEQCAGAVALVGGRTVSQLPELLATVYADIAAAAPHARVLVTGYPRLFSPEYGAYLAASPEELGALNALADTLDAVIAAAAARAHFQYVDVRRSFDGHGVNSPDAWILGPSVPGALHPTATGYEAYAAAVSSALRGLPLGCGGRR